MSDNFWFNDDAFLASNPNDNNASSNTDDFLNNIFDQNGEQSQQNPRPAGNISSAANTTSIPQDISPAAILGQQQNINPQMFMKQQLQAHHKQQTQPQMLQLPQQPIQNNQQSLNQDRKDQLLRMRQQIMQQQMLHAQQKQQQFQQLPQQLGQSMMNNNINPQSQSQSQGPIRLKNMEAQELASPNTFSRSQMPTPTQAPPVGPVNNQAQSQMSQVRSNSNSYSNSPANNMTTPALQAQSNLSQSNQTPRFSNNQVPQPSMQPQSQSVNKPPPAQIAQLQIELFLTTLNDFMNRRGSPISQPLVVNNKRVNLFFLYILSHKLGGPQVLIKSLQQPSQHQPSPWSAICQKLGLYEGVNIQQDLALKARIEKEIGNCYVQYLLPYEQYNSTPEGQKDIQQRRQHFQKQLLLRFQQPQQLPINPGSSAQNVSQLPRQSLQSSPVHSSSIASPSVNASSNMIQLVHQSPVISQAPTPQQQRKLSRVSSNQNSPNIVQSPYMQQQPISRSGSTVQHPMNMQQTQVQPQQFQRQPLVASARNLSVDVTSQVSASESPRITGQKGPQTTAQTTFVKSEQESIGKNNEPNVVKNYVPIRKVIESHAGFDIKSLSTVAGEIEITKPVYLFAPELGSINVHALIMALKNYSDSNSGEVFSALNTLLVTTSDSNYAFKISECPELLDSLASLGLRVLKQITDGKNKKIPEYEETISTNNNIENIFNRYVNQGPDLLAEEDIAFVVDSLTGQVVEDEESDMDIDDVFSPNEWNNSSTESNTPAIDESNEKMEFFIPDYMTTLLNFRKENKYHFSKIQTKNAMDDQIMLVDQLITITMILRNISFSEVNRSKMSRNEMFKDLIFETVKAIGLSSKSFVFHRKRLCLLKDCLLMLDNIAFTMELKSLEQAFLAIVLILSFGPELKDNFDIPKVNLDVYSYLPFGIDAFTKLLVREPHNRSLMQAVLNGSLNIATSNYASNPLTISPEDQSRTLNLSLAYLNCNEEDFKSGKLLTKSFQLFLSIIPYESSTYEFSKFIFTRSSTITQALFGAKLIIDMIPAEDSTSTISDLSLLWIVNNKEPLLSNLSRMAMSLIMEAAKLPPTSNEHRILSLVLVRSFIVVNSLVNDAVNISESSDHDESLREEIKSLSSLSRVIPDPNSALDCLLSPAVDAGLSKEVIRLLALLRRLSRD